MNAHCCVSIIDARDNIREMKREIELRYILHSHH